MDRERVGKYEIIGELGRGTMGEVYKALDPVLNRFVALKTLNARVSPGDETLQRFQREAQAAALLNHPNIVTVHDFGEEGGLLYMAMELLEGSDLRDAIDNERLKTLDEKLGVLDGVLAALDYAHAKGVVHRDVKPANIHLGPDRKVKIMDFGLARVSTSEMTQEGIVLGTPNYMSPEQALGDRVDGRSDLFSTGAVLYELLTGHKPFEADSTPSVLFQVVHRQPVPVRRWASATPAGVVAVVNRALQKDREKRFASAGDMRAAVAVARQAAAPRTPPLPAPRPAPPPLPPTAPPTLPPASITGATPPVLPRPRVPTPRPAASPAELRTSTPTPPGSIPPLARPSLRPLLAGAGVAALVLVLAAVGLWLRVRPAPPAAPGPGPGGADEVSALTQELVRKQAQLARRELEDKNYAAAAAEAEGVLALAPGHPEARAVLSAARERASDLDTAITEARRRLDAGDSAGASSGLSRVLELDPRHPAAVELSARLNDVFRAQADEAASSMRTARSSARAAGGDGVVLRAAEEDARRADALLASGEFADATRTFLEARDAFDRARRAAAPRGRAAPTAADPASARAPGAALAPAASAAAAPMPEPTATPTARGFDAETTAVATPPAGGLEGFDGADVSSRRPPQFTGRLEFEVLPPAVRAGEPFVVRIHVRNDGRRPVRVRGVALAAVADGRPMPAPVKALQREVPPQSRALVAEYSGVWGGAATWVLEAVVTADRDERITSRLRAH
jgi:serine/threonine protein kinase